MTDIIYGCECVGKCHVHSVWGYDSINAPIIRTAVRNGKDIKLCSRCTNDGEKLVKIHIDEDTDLMPFFNYDPCVAGAPELRGNKKIEKITKDNPEFVNKAMMKDIEQMKALGWNGEF